MSSNSQIPFSPQGQTVAIAAAAVAPAGVLVDVLEKYSAQSTGQMRIVNNNPAMVHLGYGPTAAIAQANAVAATAGSPSNAIALPPGVVEILRFPYGSYFSGVSTSNATVYLTPGQGL